MSFFSFSISFSSFFFFSLSFFLFSLCLFAFYLRPVTAFTAACTPSSPSGPVVAAAEEVPLLSTPVSEPWAALPPG
ncbi:hypothetical protein PG988_005698 [Apiospora saccharicola]